MDIDLLVAHGTVITLDPARRVLDDGAVAIHRDRIVAVGPHAELAGRYTARRTIDASRMAVLPGLIDTHGHGALNMIKTVGEDLGGAEWRTMADHLLFHCTTEEWWYADGLLTALERLKFGTTTGVSVLGSSPRTDRPIFGARHAEGVSRVGTRAILGAGFPRPPWPQAFSDWKNGTRVERSVTLEEVREATRELIRQWHGGAGGRVHVWVSASRFLAPSPYDPMFKPEQLEYATIQAREMRRLADEFGVGLHTHAFGGAVRFAHQELRVLGPDVCLAHCQGIDDEELGILRDTGTTVSYCPSARRVYSYPARCPVTELLDAGVVVAVGTDGTAPDRTFDLFKDMRMAMTLERLHFTDPWRLPPGKALEMVTIDAARALRLDRDLGSLEPGKKADLVLVNLRAPHLVPGGMPVHRVVYEATGHDVDTVIVDGVVLMEGRRVLSVDEAATVELAEAEAQQAFQRAGVQPLMAIPPDFWGRSRYAARAEPRRPPKAVTSNRDLAAPRVAPGRAPIMANEQVRSIDRPADGLTRRRLLEGTARLGAGLAAAHVVTPRRTARAQSGPGQVIVRALGGAHLAAVEKAIFKPFTEATGIKVVPVPSVAAQVLAQVQAGRAQLDVLDVGEVSMMHLEKNGALEPIPYDRFKLTNPQDIDPAMRRPRMLGNVYAATVLVYNPQVFKTGAHPRSWADFWNVEKFPGPRTLADAKTGSGAELEFALLADGAPLTGLYPIDLERAFRSLTKIKPHVTKWWETGPMSSELLERREVVLGGLWNGRAQDLIDKGAPLAIEWNQAKRLRQFYGIVKGAPNPENAVRFLDFALQPKVQAEVTRYIAYGPTNRQAHQYVRPEDAAKLPSTPAHFTAGFDQDGVWWAENLPKVTERWQTWVLG